MAEEVFGVERFSNLEYVSFHDDGKISASTYSHQINSSGYIELTEGETRRLFLAMAKFYAERSILT